MLCCGKGVKSAEASLVEADCNHRTCLHLRPTGCNRLTSNNSGEGGLVDANTFTLTHLQRVV